MPHILHRFPIKQSAKRVFAAVSTSEGLNAWWTKDCTGHAELGAEYVLDFGPGYIWRAQVTECEPNQSFELKLTKSDPDWLNSTVGFGLSSDSEITMVEFAHRGWPEHNDHFRTSSYCWAMYLRLMSRYVTTGEIVPYAERLDA